MKLFLLLLSVCSFSLMSNYGYSKEPVKEPVKGKPATSTSDFLNVRCHADSEESVYYHWSGYAYSIVAGEKQKYLFGISGMNVARCIKDKEGVTSMTSREVQVYTDDSGKILDTWENPWTNEKVRVAHVANSPVQVFGLSEYDLHETYLGKTKRSAGFTVPLYYPNPLADKKYDAYSGKSHYQAVEVFNFIYDKDDVSDVAITWSRISDYLPWMKMGGKEGKILFEAIGHRVESFGELPKVIQKVVNERVPNFKDAPTCILENENVTSWMYFKEHFDAFLKGDIFPIDIDLKNDRCQN